MVEKLKGDLSVVLDVVFVLSLGEYIPLNIDFFLVVTSSINFSWKLQAMTRKEVIVRRVGYL